MDETGRAALSWEYHGTRYWSTLGCPTSSLQVSAKTTTGAVGFQKLWRSRADAAEKKLPGLRRLQLAVRLGRVSSEAVGVV